jgi:hypothetical protein
MCLARAKHLTINTLRETGLSINSFKKIIQKVLKSLTLALLKFEWVKLFPFKSKPKQGKQCSM